MPDREKVISKLEKEVQRTYSTKTTVFQSGEKVSEEINTHREPCVRIPIEMADKILALLKEQDERLRKLQKDKDKLCLEVSEWKHKFHDAPPKFVSQGVVDQICWERDTALSQLEQIGKGLGSTMDDIVAMLKEQEAKNVVNMTLSKDCFLIASCPKCNALLTRVEHKNYCGYCGQAVKWE